MRFMMDQYFKDEPMDRLNKGLMAFASYNAGAGRIRSLRREAAKQGLDPNVWFNNVERVVAAKIGRETVTYVSNIYKYYVAYTLVVEEMNEKANAKGEAVKRWFTWRPPPPWSAVSQSAGPPARPGARSRSPRPTPGRLPAARETPSSSRPR